MKRDKRARMLLCGIRGSKPEFKTGESSDPKYPTILLWYSATLSGYNCALSP